MKLWSLVILLALGFPITAHAQLEAAVLPASRSVQVGATATAFATIINAGSATVTGCSISPSVGVPATFLYQTTNPATNAVTGTANTPVSIPGNNGLQSFIIAFSPTSAFQPTDIPFSFACTNQASAAVVNGVNTLLLSASATPVPDVVALAETTSVNGILTVSPSGSGAFAVATDNLGSGSQITAVANTGGAALPVILQICQTDPTSGACLANPSNTVTTTVNSGATPTFGIFATVTGSIAFDPANSRVFVQFLDPSGVVRGSTSVALTTGQPLNSIVYSGQLRQYLLYTPGCLAGSGPLPLVIGLHGDNPGVATGQALETTSGMSDVAEAQCFIAAYPYGLNGTWDNNSDVGFIQAVATDIESKYLVDQSRVFVFGFSGGGRLAGNINCVGSLSLRGFAVISYVLRTADTVNCTNAPKPVVLMNGTVDTLAPYNGNGSNILSAPASASFWAGRFGAVSPFVSFVNLALDNGQFAVGQISNYGPVVFYSLTGGGHAFPSSSGYQSTNGPTVTEIGNQFSDPAANLIWDFFHSQ